jgi:hypothetical protein
MSVTRLRAHLLFWFVVTVASAADPVSYSRDVRPILVERCEGCHQERNKSGRLSVTSISELTVGGVSGPAIKPGDPAASLLLEYISGPKPRMPKAGAPLAPEQVALIRTWIEQGARDDAAGAPAVKEVWWSLRPLNRPQPPSRSDQVRNPIDAFILEGLRSANLTLSREADRRTLIRRLYFDLHGLPPSPEDIESFQRDKSPDAFEKLVDRLLASPRYGERWARHWLDVVHYGESHGYDKDKPRLNAWPYRDYVIKSFNEDKPYRRFIQEQLAGDVLFPDDPEAFVATAFIAAGPWDFVGHQELREGTTDKDMTRVLDRDDMVATTISTFTSMTAHCARCHDHKFDPIRQEDYYGLQAVFAGVDRADRPYDRDPSIHAERQRLLREKRRIQIRLQPFLDQVEFATNAEIVDLDNRIQDARAQIAHLGEPKTASDRELKQALEARVVVDRKRRQAVVDAIAGQETYAAIERIKAEMKLVDARVAALPEPQMIYTATSFFQRAGNFRPSLEPRPVHVLARGNVQAPEKVAVSGALGCVPDLPARFGLSADAPEGERRAALARWISEDRNVLTWRSIVNRVWQYHFGSGIVDSPSDFGRMGSTPSHPELLDWLSIWFRDDAKGSLKRLHRLIVTSSVYRQSSANRPEAASIDSENRLLWRANRSRLDAESVRDAILAVAGKLDTTMNGPSVQMFHFKDDHSPVYDYARFDPDAPGAHRRSIYRFIVRSVSDPFMDRLDCPDPSIQTPKRSITLTAIQALAMLNNPFMIRMSRHLAERVRQTAGGDEDSRVRSAVRLVLGRPATDAEMATYGIYTRKHGLENLCRLLLNTNEFLFVD